MSAEPAGLICCPFGKKWRELWSCTMRSFNCKRLELTFHRENRKLFLDRVADAGRPIAGRTPTFRRRITPPAKSTASLRLVTDKGLLPIIGPVNVTMIARRSGRPILSHDDGELAVPVNQCDRQSPILTRQDAAMSYQHMFFGVDLDRAKSLYGSGDDTFAAELLKAQAEAFENNMGSSKLASRAETSRTLKPPSATSFRAKRIATELQPCMAMSSKSSVSTLVNQSAMMSQPFAIIRANRSWKSLANRFQSLMM